MFHAEGHTASQWQSQRWNPGPGDPEPEPLATMLHGLLGKCHLLCAPAETLANPPSPSGCRMFASSSSPGWRGHTPRPGPPPTSAAAPPSSVPASRRGAPCPDGGVTHFRLRAAAPTPAAGTANPWSLTEPRGLGREGRGLSGF